MPPPARRADRSGRIKRKTGTSAPAWPFDPASVSAKRVSPKTHLVRLVIQAFDEFPLFRSGIFFQAVLLSSYSNIASSRALRSTVVTRFLATMAPPTPGRDRPWVMYSFGSLGSGCPFPALPGLPGSSADLSCALSPTTPEGPTSACSLLPRRLQASSSLADWPPSLCVTRPHRVRLRYGSGSRPRFPPDGSPATPLGSATCSNEQFTW